MGALLVGVVRGVPLRLHHSLFVALPVFAWFAELEMRAPVTAAALADGRALASSWTWAALLTFVLAAALLVHQGAHLAVARALGAEVGEVTLVLLGGCARGCRGPASPVSSGARTIAVSAAGPVASLLGAALCYGVLRLHPPAHADGQQALHLAAEVQLALGVIDLLPRPSLDGGRVLVALLARRVGRLRALALARRLGRILAASCAVAGTVAANALLIAVAAILWTGPDRSRRGAAERARCAPRHARRPRPPARAPAVARGDARGNGKREKRLYSCPPEDPACFVASPSSCCPSPPRSPSPPAPTTTSTTSAPRPT